jgi:hypothetical protein
MNKVMSTFTMVHNITCNDVVNTSLPTDDDGEDGDGGGDDHSSSSGGGSGGHDTKSDLGFRSRPPGAETAHKKRQPS